MKMLNRGAHMLGWGLSSIILKIRRRNDSTALKEGVFSSGNDGHLWRITILIIFAGYLFIRCSEG
jgi:hypothetical protein